MASDRITEETGRMRRQGIIAGIGGLLLAASLALAFVLPARVFPTSLIPASWAQGDTVRIIHQPPTNPAHRAAFERIRGDATLEAARAFFAAFKLPKPLTLTTRSCSGRGGAWYYEGNVTVCYEYLQAAYDSAASAARPDWVSEGGAVRGQIADVFIHEGAHALFEMFGTPLMGREEDAADQFATFAILNLFGAEAPQMIRGVAYSYLVDAQARTFGDLPRLEARTVPSRAYGGAHSTPLQRMFSIVCHAAGFDEAAYRDLVAMSDLPHWRAGSCEDEYKQIAHAFRVLLLPQLDVGKLRAAFPNAALAHVN
jgi:hypothetical protein